MYVSSKQISICICVMVRPSSWNVKHDTFDFILHGLVSINASIQCLKKAFTFIESGPRGRVGKVAVFQRS